MRHVAVVVVGALVCAAACGPSMTNADDDGAGDAGGDDDDDQPPPPPPPTGSVTGTVWAPGHAPGMVPDGYEMPISGALVYVAGESPAAIPDEVYCDRCELRPAVYATTDAKGKIELTGVPSGEHLVVVEKAQFRLETTIDVPVDTGLALTDAQTTLPSEHDPDNGKWIPRVAIAIGDSDQIEDIFAKMGILGLESDGRVEESSFASTDRVELYGNPIDPPFPSHHQGTISQLFGDLERMRRYHIIFVPCNYETDVSPLTQPSVRKNIRDYVAAGGKLYVTDWSAEWEDAAFPEFIEFDASTDTTAAMASANTINHGDGDFGHFAMHGKAADPGLRDWLDGQKAPLVIPIGGEDMDFPSEYEEGVVDADDFVIEGNWSLIRELPTVNIGTDENGDPINVTAKTWISGDYMGSYYPHTVTFEPSCGRVLYSTYHTAQKTHQHLVPQERVLLFLILEIGVCNDGPIID
jgi:hypothetical protein